MYAISQVEVSVCVTAVKDVSVSVTVGLPLSLERNTLVLTVAVILTTAIVRSTLGLVGREGRREGGRVKSEHTYFLLQLSLHAVYIHAYSAWCNWSLFACFPCALCCVVLFLVGITAVSVWKSDSFEYSTTMSETCTMLTFSFCPQ